MQMAKYDGPTWCKHFRKKERVRERERCGRWWDGGGGWGKTSGKKKKKPQQAIRLIFSQPGLWVHCLVFAGAQAVCPGGATF